MLNVCGGGRKKKKKYSRSRQVLILFGGQFDHATQPCGGAIKLRVAHRSNQVDYLIQALGTIFFYGTARARKLHSNILPFLVYNDSQTNKNIHYRSSDVMKKS